MVKITDEGLLSLERLCESLGVDRDTHIAGILTGMSIGLDQPEYAVAFRAFFGEMDREFEMRANAEFMRNVPIEGILEA